MNSRSGTTRARGFGTTTVHSERNRDIQLLAGRTHFLEQWRVMASDEQPLALQEFLEMRGSRKTGAKSKTSTATKVDRGQLASLLAECPWAEEYMKSMGNPRTTPAVPTQEDEGTSSLQLGRASRPSRTLG